MTSTAYFKEHALKNGETPYSMRGVAKAWVNFNGAGTVAIRDSENISSVTDNGSGDYTVNLTNAFSGTDYLETCNPLTEGGGRGLGGLATRITDFAGGAPTSKTSSSVRLTAVYGSSSSSDGSAVDTNPCSVTFSGDLA